MEREREIDVLVGAAGLATPAFSVEEVSKLVLFAFVHYVFWF